MVILILNGIKKRIKYLQEAEKFLERKKPCLKLQKVMFFFNNLNKAKRVTLYVENIGNFESKQISGLKSTFLSGSLLLRNTQLKISFLNYQLLKYPKRKSFMEGISLDFLELPNIHALDVSTVKRYISMLSQR